MNSKKIVTALVLGGALIFASVGHARGTITGTISSITSSNSVINVFFDSDIVAISGTTIPSCATKTNRFTLAPDQKNQLAILLTAYSLGNEVQIKGTGTCVTRSDTEDVSIILLQ